MLARLLERDPHRVDAAHLAGADADRLQALRDHDRVRRDVLADAPREQQVAPLLLGRRCRDDLHQLAVVDVDVALLHEQAAEHALVVALAGRLHAALAVDEEAQRGFARSAATASASKPGASSTSTKCSAIRAPSAPPTGRLRTRRSRMPRPGSAASARSYASSIDARDRDAARVRVLDDHGGRHRRTRARRGVRPRGRRGCCTRAPCRRAARRARADGGAGPPRRSTRRAGAGSRRRRGRRPCGSSASAAAGRARCRRTRARSPRRTTAVVAKACVASMCRVSNDERAVDAQLVEHQVVLLGRGTRDHVREVLRRGAQHRRAADVDHLDRLGLGHAAAAGDGREG